MAAGDSLLLYHPYSQEPNYSGATAKYSSHNGHPVIVFAESGVTASVFTSIMPRNYASGGGVLYIHWACLLTTGNAVWGAQFERIGEEIQDLSIESFASAQEVTDAAPSTAEVVAVAVIPFTHGAQMDNVANGELFRLKIYRNGDDVSDTLAGVAHVLSLELRETP